MMRDKRLPSFILAGLVLVSAWLMPGSAGDGSRNDPYEYQSNSEQFPEYPSPGSVSAIKKGEWSNKEEGIAQVKFDLSAIPADKGSDVFLVLDSSGSMGDGESSSGFSACLDASHYVTRTFTKKKVLTYVSTDSEKYVSMPVDGVELTAKLHRIEYDEVAGSSFSNANSPFNGKYSIVEVSVDTSKFPKEYNGKAITNYYSAKNATYEFLLSDLNNFSVDGLRYTDAKINAIRNLLLPQNQASTYGFGGAVSNEDSDIVMPTYATTEYLASRNVKGSSAYVPSKGCYFRMDVAKQAANAFVDTLFSEENSDHNLSIISFNDTATDLNSGAYYRVDTKNKAKSDINAMKSNGATSYVNALGAVQKILEARADNDRNVYVLFMSDGEPYLTPDINDKNKRETDEQVRQAFDAFKNKTNAVYSIGINLLTDYAKSTIQIITNGSGQNINVADENIESLRSEFVKIAEQIPHTAKNAVLEDVIGPEFELITNDSRYPMEVKIDNTLVGLNNVKIEDGNRKIVWTLGEIPNAAQLSYYVRIKANTPSGTYETNKNADVIYQNVNDSYCRQHFENPKLEYDNGIKSELDVTVIHNKEDGTLISQSKPPVTPDRNTDMSSWFLDSSYNVKPVEIIIEINGDTPGLGASGGLGTSGGNTITIDVNNPIYNFKDGYTYVVYIKYEDIKTPPPIVDPPKSTRDPEPDGTTRTDTDSKSYNSINDTDVPKSPAPWVELPDQDVPTTNLPQTGGTL